MTLSGFSLTILRISCLGWANFILNLKNLRKIFGPLITMKLPLFVWLLWFVRRLLVFFFCALYKILHSINDFFCCTLKSLAFIWDIHPLAIKSDICTCWLSDCTSLPGVTLCFPFLTLATDRKYVWCMYDHKNMYDACMIILCFSVTLLVTFFYCSLDRTYSWAS